MSRRVPWLMTVPRVCLWLLAAVLFAGCSDTVVDVEVEESCTFAFGPLPGVYNDDVEFEATSTHIEKVQVVVDVPEGTPSGLELSNISIGTIPVASGPAVAYTGKITLSDGSHIISAKDPCAETDSWYSFHYTIDPVGPAVTISPESGLFRPPVNVSVNSTAADRLYARVYEQGGTPGTLVPVTTAPIGITQDGTWIIEGLAEDNAGNTNSVTAVITINSISPAIRSVLTPGGMEEAARWPLFDVEFDQEMNASGPVIADLFVPEDGGEAIDGMAVWTAVNTVELFPLSYLDADTGYDLDLQSFTGTNNQSLAAVQGSFGVSTSFSTINSTLADGVVGSMSVTSAEPWLLFGSAEPVVLYARIASPPDDVELLTFLGAYASSADDPPILEVAANSQVIAESAQEAVVRVEFDMPDARINRVSTLFLTAFDTEHEFYADDYVGIFALPLTPPTSGTESSTFSAETTFTVDYTSRVPGLNQHDNPQIRVDFSAVPDIRRFSLAASAAINEQTDLTIVKPIWDFCGGSLGTAIRFTLPTELSDGGTYRLWLDNTHTTDLYANATSVALSEIWAYYHPETAPPQFLRTSLSDDNKIAILGEAQLFGFMVEDGAYELVDWELRNNETNLVWPIFREAKVALPNRRGVSYFSFRTIADVDHLPAGLTFTFTGTLRQANGAEHDVTFDFETGGAIQKTVGSIVGTGAALLTADGLQTVNSTLEIGTGTSGLGSFTVDFTDVLSDIGLITVGNPTVASQQKNLHEGMNNSPGPLPSPDYRGGIHGHYRTSIGLLLGAREYFIFTDGQIPQLLAPAAGFTTSEEVTFTWDLNVSMDTAAIGLRVAEADAIADVVLDLRFAAIETDTTLSTTLPAGTLPAGTYEWYIYSIANSGDPFNLPLVPMLDAGYAASVTRTLIIE